MKCPVCKDVTLLMSEKKGVEIDYCPECRGIWLDRGELEKLIDGEERAYRSYRDNRSDDDNYHNRSDARQQHQSDDRRYDKHNRQPRKHKRESFLGEIFEMFGD